jgi:hypothetical protein
MSDKPPTDSNTPEPAAPSKGSPFKHFQRRPKTERAPSGRVLPPAPAWMKKPLKPPGFRSPADGS